MGLEAHCDLNSAPRSVSALAYNKAPAHGISFDVRTVLWWVLGCVVSFNCARCGTDLVRHCSDGVLHNASLCSYCVLVTHCFHILHQQLSSLRFVTNALHMQMPSYTCCYASCTLPTGRYQAVLHTTMAFLA
eukprot:10992-Heterococcus_DN1.PRE.3